MSLEDIVTKMTNGTFTSKFVDIREEPYGFEEGLVEDHRVLISTNNKFEPPLTYAFYKSGGITTGHRINKEDGVWVHYRNDGEVLSNDYDDNMMEDDEVMALREQMETAKPFTGTMVDEDGWVWETEDVYVYDNPDGTMDTTDDGYMYRNSSGNWV